MIRIALLLLAINLVFSAREPKQITLVNQGTISGVYITRFRTKRIAAYLGIPYAQPPIDLRRFQAPDYTILPAWEDVKNATSFAPDCMQSEPNAEEGDVQRVQLSKHDKLFGTLLESQLEEPRKKEFSEDCLYLNVYVPDGFKIEGYPTMVWFHGGNFMRGSPNDLNPFQLVLSQKVIFVSVAYRLNIFGFFSTLDQEATGNYGILDQVAALNWVKNNIAAFGGDPDNVCIFGHDAGAVSVGLHLISSYSSGLFQKAIAMSGNVLSPDTVNTPRRELITVDKVATAFSCFRKPSYQLLGCLRRVPYQALLQEGEYLTEWKPIVDLGFSNSTTAFLPDLPSKLFKDEIFSPVPVLTGYTNMEDALLLAKDSDDTGISQKEFDAMREEIILADITVDNSSCFTNQHHIQDAVSFFYKPIPPTTNETILRKLFLDFYTDKVHGATTYQLAKHLSQHAPVYLYRFDLKPFSDIANEGIPDWISVPHNFDLIYTFGLPHLAQPGDWSKWDKRDKSISEIIMKMWSNFAWYSHPTNSSVRIEWEAFELEKPGYLIIDRNNFTMSTPETINYKAFEFWTDFYPKVVEIGTKCCKEPTDDSGSTSILHSRLLTSLLTVHIITCQRGSFAGKRPIGYPELLNRTTTTVDPLGNRFGAGDSTTERLPVEANGDRDLVDRISKWPIDKQPFWYLNWKALEEQRKNPQTFAQRPSQFAETPNFNTGTPNSNAGTQNSNAGTQNSNAGALNSRFGTNSNDGTLNSNTGTLNSNPGTNFNTQPLNSNLGTHSSTGTANGATLNTGSQHPLNLGPRFGDPDTDSDDEDHQNDHAAKGKQIHQHHQI
ncbi:carboxylesterase 1E [Leguminivora glycinivorella]|uniref:carboxylesterase 1E n=1 Tax=Leguminivora glycinivorella TaxID=1035111 RepID=UPI00200CEDCE|nr:carboxylesterase 1E [Leguminivora glycinivorella]